MEEHGNGDGPAADFRDVEHLAVPSPAHLSSAASSRPTTPQQQTGSPRPNSLATPPSRARRPSIRVRRAESQESIHQLPFPAFEEPTATEDVGVVGRRRSSSEPQRMSWGRTQPNEANAESSQRRGSYLPEITEERPSMMLDRAAFPPVQEPQHLAVPAQTERSGMLRRASVAARSGLSGLQRLSGVGSVRSRSSTQGEELDQDTVNLLDVVDPEVSTLSTLTNVQNSLFVPELGRWLNRRPTYTLDRFPSDIIEDGISIEEKPLPELPEQEGTEGIEEAEAAEGAEGAERPGPRRTTSLTTITSRLTDSHYAVMPHGKTSRTLSKEDQEYIDNHVRHALHSRRAKFKRSMKGFRKYISKPLGFFITLYATLITLFGLAWVLFLIGWINVGGKKDYVVNVIDNVLVALFAIMGDGLAPFRIRDTYHMIFIAHYHRLTWHLRKEKQMPALHNENDLPSRTEQEADLEMGAVKPEFSVLTPKQQKRLDFHTEKFSNSHTFYKPHETATHHAFPLKLLIAIVSLLDAHSCLQIALGTCTWSIDYHTRPFALTTVILCCSITVNITAGILITVGDHKTRKKEVIERMFRQQLTEQAMRHLNRKKREEMEGNLGGAKLQKKGSPTSSLSEKISRDGKLAKKSTIPKSEE